MLKKIMTTILIFTLALNSSLTVFASIESRSAVNKNTSEQEEHNNMVEEQHQNIVALISDLTKLKMEQMNLVEQYPTKDNSTKMYSMNNNIIQIENQLDALGVTKSPEPLTDKSMLDASVLAASSNNEIRTETISRFYVQGLPYTVKHEYSIPKTLYSNQVTSDSGVSLYSGSTTLDSILKLISIYAQKTIGTIPIIAWTPYELLIPTNAVKINSLTFDYVAASTICYSWVKPYGSTNAYYQRSMVTNHMTCEATFTSKGIRSNGYAYAEPSGKKFVQEYAQNYANTAKAVNSYVYEFSRYYSLVNAVEIKCLLTGAVAKKVRLPIPM